MLATFALLLTILILALAAIRWRVRTLRRKVAEARSWPTAKGEMVRSALEMKEFDDGDEVFRARVEFEYKVAGRVYRSDRLLLLGRSWFGLRTRARAIVARYPVGASVVVHHHPTMPELAALELDSHEFELWREVSGVIVVALVLLLAGALLLPGVFGAEPVIEWDFEAFVERIRRALK